MEAVEEQAALFASPRLQKADRQVDIDLCSRLDPL